MAIKKLKKATFDSMALDLSGETIQGWKTILGLILIQAAHQLDAFADMLKVLPSNNSLVFLHDTLAMILPYIEKALTLLSSGSFTGGSIMVVIGVLAKVFKFGRSVLGLIK